MFSGHCVGIYGNQTLSDTMAIKSTSSEHHS